MDTEQQKHADLLHPDADKAAMDLPSNVMIVIPVRNMVVFPGLVVPITVGREASVAAAQQAVRSERQVGILLQRNPAESSPGADDLYSVGTASDILRYVTTPDGLHHIVCQGEHRFRVIEFLDDYPFMAARVEHYLDLQDENAEIEARMLQLKQRTAEGRS